MISLKKSTLPATLTLAVALACTVLLILPSAGFAKDGKPHQLRIDSLTVGSMQGPLTIRVRAGLHAKVTIWVGKHQVRHPFEYAGRRAQAISLRSGDGLHPGRNRIRIRAGYGAKTYEARRTVEVPGWALLADAGEDIDSRSRARMQLGAGRAVAGKDGLDYRWSIAKRPSHKAKATLIDRDDPQPVFHATTPGTYVLQLEVNQDGDGPGSFDQVTVPVAPNDPPIGAPINTLTSPGKAIAVGDKTYGGGDCQCTSYVLLQRTTRDKIADGRVDNNADGLAQLNKLADDYGSGDKLMGYLLILSGPQGVPHDRLEDFAKLLKRIGVTLPLPETFATLESSKAAGYSVIGIPGAPAGAGTLRVPNPAEGTAAADSAAIVGYLQRNQVLEGSSAPLYEYVSPEHPTFDTRAAGTATANTMVVNGSRYEASLKAPATAGFQVAVFNSLTMAPLANVALETNAPSRDDHNRQKVAAESLGDLLKRSGDPLVLVQSIGKPKGAGAEWNGIVTQLARLGANPQLLYALDGTNEYALVAHVGGEAPPVEASTAYEGSSGNPHYPAARLTGMVTRGRNSRFLPNVTATPTAASSSAVNLAMVEIAYQPATAWPELAPGAPRTEVDAAQKYICEVANFCQPADSCSQIRECFWQKYNSDWHSKARDIDHAAFVPNRGFLEPTFKAVRDELAHECSVVAQVKNYFELLEVPLDRSKVGSYVDLQQIGESVKNAVTPLPNSETKSWILGLLSKVALVGTAAGPPVSNASAGISAAFGLASYLSNKQGQPILGTEVKVRTDALAGEMVSRLEMARKSLDGLALLMVSDYGKLEAAYKHVDSDWSLPKTGNDPSDNIRFAAKQWYWEALIPTAYPYLIRSVAPSAQAIDCRISDGRRAWPNQPGPLDDHANVRFNQDGSAVKGVYFFARGIGGAASPDWNKVKDSLYPIFKPVNEGGLGIERLSFYSGRAWGGIVHAENGVQGCGAMWLPNLW